nr:PREDICTED: uncharacterized protein LOC109044775 [Bemisia tabaci]
MQDTCDNYFRSINILAKLISADIEETKDAYQDLWNTLTAEEKCQALDDAIIHPDAVLKYSVYEDEDLPHSGIYHQHSCLSKSQQNLSCAVNLQVLKPLTIIRSPIKKKESTKQPSINVESTILETKQSTKPAVENVGFLNKIKSKVCTQRMSAAADEERELLCDSKTQICIVPKGSVLKPKNPPPPPPTSKTNYDEESALFSSFENLNISISSTDCKIPKTGFDFLDNW